METIERFNRTIKISEKGIKAKNERVKKEKGVIPLISGRVIKKRVGFLGRKISNDFKKEIHIVAILNGAFVFCSDLVREIDNRKIFLHFIEARSYEKTRSTGKVRILKDAKGIKGKDVLIVEDLIDTGFTINRLKDHFLKKKKVKSVKVCCLVDKPYKRKFKIKVDYLGFEVSDLFIVGYGMDYEEKYRNLSYIGFLKNI